MGVPGVGMDIRLTAAVTNECAALVLTDGKKTWHTPPVTVDNTRAGKTGLRLHQIGEQQQFDTFRSISDNVCARSAAQGQRKDVGTGPVRRVQGASIAFAPGLGAGFGMSETVRERKT